MNKKFFAALASATMAFTASGSIAVFADDFVEEKTPVVDNGDVTPKPAKVLWNKENFGDLATEDLNVGTVGVNPAVAGLDTVKPDEKGYVKTETLEDITSLTLNAGFKGEIKGLEYFTGLTSFSAEADTVEVTNKTLDFSANTKLATLAVTKAADLTGITLPESYKNDDDEDTYSLTSLTLDGTKLNSLDLSKQEELDTILVRENKNLSEITLRKATQNSPVVLTKLGLRDNALETVNLDRYTINQTLNLSGNHIGALDLSKTTVNPSNVTLDRQTFYVSETLKNVNLKETFENFDVKQVAETTGFDTETGVLTLESDGQTTYKYMTTKGKLVVTLTAANPMNRLYNPNSGEHFYTADIKEKEALVALGWNDEGYGWVAAPTNGATEEQAVYRLYNPNAGDHHYTMDENEVKTLKAYGWKDEGTGWYSGNRES